LVYNESKFILMGQTGTQSNLNKEIVQELRIPLPQRNEQIEIAGILSNIDNEIDVLEQKLRKSQMIKQGMMQALLTGKIRLV
jgi:type I restriction enzyme S subunit